MSFLSWRAAVRREGWTSDVWYTFGERGWFTRQVAACRGLAAGHRGTPRDARGRVAAPRIFKVTRGGGLAARAPSWRRIADSQAERRRWLDRDRTCRTDRGGRADGPDAGRRAGAGRGRRCHRRAARQPGPPRLARRRPAC